MASEEEKATILIVDDDLLNREFLRLNLERFGYHLLSAENGKDAMGVLAANPEIDLILLDLMMPEMDGFAFLDWRRGDESAKTIPVIVNSSLDDFDSLVAALGMDTYDYFTKPLDKEQLANILPVKIKNAISSRRMLMEIARQNEVMRAELELAARYQRFLLPATASLNGLKADFLFQPCTGVGGDYFDLLTLPDGKIVFLVADVSGHGVASAMTATVLKALLPTYLERHLSPAASLAELNQDLYRLTPPDVFVTCFAGIYDRHDSCLTFSSAGHPPAIFQSHDGTTQRLENQGVLLGAFPKGHEVVDYRDGRMRVRPGHRLAFYTDGLIEAPNPAGELFGLKRVENILQSGFGEPVRTACRGLREKLFAFTGGIFPDDVAFILLEF